MAWACALYADLIGHWRKRSGEGLANVDPRRLDSALLAQLAERYATGELLEEIRRVQGRIAGDDAKTTGGVANLDDFAACEIERVEDFLDLFVRSFAFGCEADDPANAWAFDRRVNPLGARLSAMFGSDIGHFDVPDVSHVLPEAYELVDDGLITADDFRDFTFGNVVRFQTAANPNFFKGTVVEKAAEALTTASTSP